MTRYGRKGKDGLEKMLTSPKSVEKKMQWAVDVNEEGQKSIAVEGLLNIVYSKSRHYTIEASIPFLYGAKSPVEMFFAASTFGARGQTRLGSRIKKFKPHIMYDKIDFSGTPSSSSFAKTSSVSTRTGPPPFTHNIDACCTHNIDACCTHIFFLWGTFTCQVYSSTQIPRWNGCST